MKKNLKNSISAQLLNSIFRIYLILAIIITLFQLKFEFDEFKNVVIDRLKAIEKTFAPALANATWQLDDEGVTWILKGIMSNAEIVGIKMKLDGTKRNREMGVVEAKGDSFFDGLISHKILLLANKKNRFIGELTLFSTNKIIIDHLKYGFFLVLINSLIKTTLLWMIMFFYVRKILANPIEQLTDEIRDIQEDNLQKISIEYKMDNEIMVLEKSFNKMVDGVQKYQKLVDFANKTKTEFLMNMGHELKTPINQINGFTTVLAKRDLDSESKYYLSEIQGCTGQLLKLIENILYLSKSVDEELELDEVPVSFKIFIEDVVMPFKKMASIKGLDFKFNLDDGYPSGLILDEEKTTMILNEVFTNAIKFTEKGSVKINVNTKINESGNCCLKVIVKDTGPGIAKDYHKKIFDNFVQLNADEKNKHGGTGLGLSLALKLIELMGGEILVNSSSEEGSEFLINIPNLKTHVVENVDAKVKDDLSGESDLVIKIDFEGSELIEFTKEFENVVFKDWKNLVDTMDIEKLAEYSETVIELGKKYKFDLLVSLGDELKVNIELFDVEQIPLVMWKFQLIKDELAKKIDPNDDSKAS